jgi:hypothetical protein
MSHKQTYYKDNQNAAIFMDKAGWVLRYRPDKVSQPWSILDSYDKKISAIIKAYQVSANYFMIKVTDSDGIIIWST